MILRWCTTPSRLTTIDWNISDTADSSTAIRILFFIASGVFFLFSLEKRDDQIGVSAATGVGPFSPARTELCDVFGV
jgi:hypothetical protein